MRDWYEQWARGYGKFIEGKRVRAEGKMILTRIRERLVGNNIRIKNKGGGFGRKNIT